MDLIDIRNPFPGALCYRIESTGSTQAEARRLAEAGLGAGPRSEAAFPPGSLVAAEEQSAGRGRFPERGWVSEPGKNLLFTIFLDPGLALRPDGRPLPGLPLRIGCALCAAVADYGLSPRLKWPNDLMLGDRKAAGILCEAGPLGVFAGIGLNCNQVDFPPELDARATSLAMELGRELERWALLERVLDKLAAALGEEEWRRGAEAALWRRGEAATFLPGVEGVAGRGGRGALVGRVEGIDEEGSLLFKAEGAEAARAYAAGELRSGAMC